jgi:hypothetical protein
MSRNTGKQWLVRELPKKRRRTEVSVSLQWQPWCRRRAYFDLKIDIGFVSRGAVVSRNLHVRALSARVPTFK